MMETLQSLQGPGALRPLGDQVLLEPVSIPLDTGRIVLAVTAENDKRMEQAALGWLAANTHRVLAVGEAVKAVKPGDVVIVQAKKLRVDDYTPFPIGSALYKMTSESNLAAVVQQ